MCEFCVRMCVCVRVCGCVCVVCVCEGGFYNPGRGFWASFGKKCVECGELLYEMR